MFRPVGRTLGLPGTTRWLPRLLPRQRRTPPHLISTPPPGRGLHTACLPDDEPEVGGQESTSEEDDIAEEEEYDELVAEVDDDDEVYRGTSSDSQDDSDGEDAEGLDGMAEEGDSEDEDASDEEGETGNPPGAEAADGSGEDVMPLMLNPDEQRQYDAGLNVDPGVVFGEYTPHVFVSFLTDDPDTFCAHQYTVRIKAPVSDVFFLLSQWRYLPLCFDLLDTIAQDEVEEDAAIVHMFYKWRSMPILQTVFSVRRYAEETEDDGSRIMYVTEDGMPLLAKFHMRPDPEDESYTLLDANIEHATPTLMHEWVGHMAFSSHINGILAENLKVLQLLLERELDPSDLPAYYAENRLDAYDGPEKDGNMDWVPDDTRLFIEDDTPEEREAELEQMAMALVAMNDAVKAGEYVATENGWASTSLTDEQVVALDDLAGWHRYNVLKQVGSAAAKGESGTREDAETTGKAKGDGREKQQAATSGVAGDKGAASDEQDDEDDGFTIYDPEEKQTEPVDLLSIEGFDLAVEKLVESTSEPKELLYEEVEEDLSRQSARDEALEEPIYLAEDDDASSEEEDEDDESDEARETRDSMAADGLGDEDAAADGEDDQRPTLELDQLPSMKEMSEWTPEQEERYMNKMAAKLGVTEWEKIKEELEIEPEVLQNTVEALVRSEELGREAAEKEGKSYEDWYDEQLTMLQDNAEAKLKGLAEEAGMPYLEYLDAVREFEQESQNNARRAGMTQEMYLATMVKGAHDTEKEMEAQAAALGVSVSELLAIESRVRRDAASNAEGHGVSEDEYVRQVMQALANEARSTAAAGSDTQRGQ